MRSRSKIRANKVLVIALIWFIVAALMSAITFLNQIQGEPVILSGPEIFLYEILCILPWAISTPLIIWIARKYRLQKKHILANLPAHILTALFVFVFHSVIQSFWTAYFYEFPLTWSYLKIDFVGFLDMRLMLYSGVVLGVYLIDFQRKNRQTKLREPQLKKQLSKARYQAILNQTQPAFLLNSINSIQESIEYNTNNSEEILLQFSELLRLKLQNSNEDHVPLIEDLESIKLYWELMEKRLGINIDKTINIADDCYEALIPVNLVYMLLIFVFEEIISEKAKNLNKLNIIYLAERRDNFLYISINIKDIELSKQDLAGYLKQQLFVKTKQDLQNRYKEKINVTIKAPPGAIKVNIKMPYITLHTDKEFINTAINLNEA